MRAQYYENQFELVCDELCRVGVALRKAAGEYWLCSRDDISKPIYKTENLSDARSRGLELAQTLQKREPPMGPLGSSAIGRRKARIYQHNRKILWKRQSAKR